MDVTNLHIFFVLLQVAKAQFGQYGYHQLQFPPTAVSNAYFYPISPISPQKLRKNQPQRPGKETKRQNTPNSRDTQIHAKNIPFVSSPKNIPSTSSVYKRWGPKFVIVENNKKHSVMDLPQISLSNNLQRPVGHNAKVVQYNIEAPQYTNNPKDNSKPIARGLLNTQVRNTKIIKQPFVNKRVALKDGTSKIIPPSTNQASYKRFTSMRYKKRPISNMYRELIESDENAQTRSLVNPDDIRSSVSNDVIHSKSDDVNHAVVNTASKQDMIMKELMKEKEELVRNYFRNKKNDDEELYRKVTGKSKLLGFVYNVKNNTIEHERSDEPQYETAPKSYQENTPQIVSNNLVSKLTLNPNNIFSPVDEKITFESQPSRKTTGDPKSTVIKEHIIKQLQLEENMKHGEQLSEVNDYKLDKKRPKLELGEDLHGSRAGRIAGQVSGRVFGQETSSDPVYPMANGYTKMMSRSESFDGLNKDLITAGLDGSKLLTNKKSASPQNKLSNGLRTTSPQVPKIKDDFPTEKIRNLKVKANMVSSSGKPGLNEAATGVKLGDTNVKNGPTSQLRGTNSLQVQRKPLAMPAKPDGFVEKGKYNPNNSIENESQIHENERPDTDPQGNFINNRLPQQTINNENEENNVGIGRNFSNKRPLLPGPGLFLAKLRQPNLYTSSLKSKNVDNGIFTADSMSPPPGSININSLYVYNVKGKDNSIKMGSKHDVDEEGTSAEQKVTEILSKENTGETSTNESNTAPVQNSRTAEKEKETEGLSLPISKTSLTTGVNEASNENSNSQTNNNLAKQFKSSKPSMKQNRPGIITKIKLEESNPMSLNQNTSNERVPPANTSPAANASPAAKTHPQQNVNLEKLKDNGKLVMRIRHKRPPAQPCKDNECEGDLMKDMKYKIGVLYDKLFLRGANHMIQVFSSGCHKFKCDGATSSIRFDGMELGGKSDGFNIVVLSYPGFEFLYSKTYATGMDVKESTKMVQFFSELQPPYVIMIAAQRDVFTLMTPLAIQQMELLLGTENLIKTPGSSLAFIGFRGEEVMPWQQLNQELPGRGGSASYALLGSDHEYISFGGSGPTINEYIKELQSEEDNDADTRDTTFRQKYNPVANEPSLILSPVKEKQKTPAQSQSLVDESLKVVPMNIQSEYVQPFGSTTNEKTGTPSVEAEGDNEPQILSNEKLKKLGDFYSSKVPHQHLINESHDEVFSHEKPMHTLTEEDKSFEAGLSTENSDEQTSTAQKRKHMKPTSIDEGVSLKLPAFKSTESSPEEGGDIPNPQTFHPDFTGSASLTGQAGNRMPEENGPTKITSKEENNNKTLPVDDATFITKEMSKKLKDGEAREKLKDGFSIKGAKAPTSSLRDSEKDIPVEGNDSVPFKSKSSSSKYEKPDKFLSKLREENNESSSDSTKEVSTAKNSKSINMGPEETPEINNEASDSDSTGMKEKNKSDKNSKSHEEGIKNLMEKQKELLEKGKDIEPADAAKNLHELSLPEHPKEIQPQGIISPEEKDVNLPGMAYNEHALSIPNFHDKDLHGLPVQHNPPLLPSVVNGSPHIDNVPINEGHRESPAFYGNLVNTGHLNSFPIDSTEVYAPHPAAMPGVLGEQLYAPHNPPIAPNILPPPPPDIQTVHGVHHPVPVEHTVPVEHAIPVYNGPHPFMLTSNTPIEPPEKFSNPQEEKEKAAVSAKHNADSELQSPEFQKKLKEMLAEELTKKLSELKISPEKRVKTETQSHKKSSSAQNKLKSSYASKTESDNSPHYEDENNEQFVEGEDGDFDDKVKLPATLTKTNRDSTMKEGEEDVSSLQSNDNKTIIDNSNNYFDVKIEDKSGNLEVVKNKELIKHDTNEIDMSVSGGDIKSKTSKTESLEKTPSNLSDAPVLGSHKYDRGEEKSSDESDITSKYDRQSNLLYHNKDSKIQKTSTSKETSSEKQDFAKQDNSVDFANLNANESLSNKNGKTATDNSDGKMESEEQYIEKENQHLEEALHSELKKERPKQVKELKKLVDDQEELFDNGKPSTNTVSDAVQKDLVKPLQHYQDLADASLISNENETSPRVTCKRYAVSKIKKGGKYRMKKNCVEKETPRKLSKGNSKFHALPDTQESVGALSLNPGYSTLPGAESHPASSHEVSYYFDNNKMRHNLAGFRDNIYGDATSSNIYDQGDYTNVAESLLQKDVQDTFSAANDIISAQEIIEKAKNIKKKEKISKIDKDKKSTKASSISKDKLKKPKSLQHSQDKNKKRTQKPFRKNSIKKLDSELKKSSFKWR